MLQWNGVCDLHTHTRARVENFNKISLSSLHAIYKVSAVLESCKIIDHRDLLDSDSDGQFVGCLESS